MYQFNHECPLTLKIPFFQNISKYLTSELGKGVSYNGSMVLPIINAVYITRLGRLEPHSIVSIESIDPIHCATIKYSRTLCVTDCNTKQDAHRYVISFGI